MPRIRPYPYVSDLRETMSSERLQHDHAGVSNQLGIAQPVFSKSVVPHGQQMERKVYLRHRDVPLDGFGVGHRHGHVARDSSRAGHDGILHVVDALSAWRKTKDT